MCFKNAYNFFFKKNPKLVYRFELLLLKLIHGLGAVHLIMLAPPNDMDPRNKTMNCEDLSLKLCLFAHIFEYPTVIF